MNWPQYSKKEINKVTNIIKSGKVNYWTGFECKKFEKEFAKYFGIKYCVSVANASLGLEAALLSLNLKKNDEVITTPRSYNSTASSILRAGATVVFADIDKQTQNIDPNSIISKITKNTKAILCVHLGGMPCDMYLIQKITKKYNLKLIEDCSQAHGAKYFNKYVGSFGDISVWSFCNDKIISTLGEGGMIGTKTYNNFKKIWSIKEIGKDFLLSNTKEKTSFKWVHNNLGTNMRMTEVQAGVGRLQLKALAKNIKKRRILANLFFKRLSKSKLFQPPIKKIGYNNSYYKFYLFLNPNVLKKKFIRSKIISFLKKQNIQVSVGSCPEIYREKIFNKIRTFEKLPNANYVGKVSIAFSINQFQKLSYINKICNNLKYIEKTINIK